MGDKSSDLVQGTLDMLVLKTLALEAMHGYGITIRIEQMSRGVFRLNAGSLFLDIQRLEKDGMSRKDALRAVRLERGSLELTKEVVRSGGWESFVETCWRDLRVASRTLRKSPGFTVVAVLTLALGIGVNTAIFSALNATIFHPLAYENPEQLVMVWGVEPKGCCRHGGMVFSSPNFLDFKDQNRVFEKMAAFDGTEFTITSLENPQRIHAGRVTADFFTLLRARPMLGRTFL